VSIPWGKDTKYFTSASAKYLTPLTPSPRGEGEKDYGFIEGNLLSKHMKMA
jgi:hypothetical protein